MSNIEPIYSYTFPTSEYYIASLSIRVADLAERLNCHCLIWKDDGVGTTNGFACRLSSGHVFLLSENVVSIKYHQALGPSLAVDATLVATLGVESLLNEFLDASGLSHADLADAADQSAESEAATLVARIEAHRRGKPSL